MQKKSILFIADKPNWAYHNIIKTWYEDLQHEYDCYIAFAQDFFLRQKDYTVLDKIQNTIIGVLNSENLRFKIDKTRKFATPEYKTPPVYRVGTNQKIHKTHFDFHIEMAYYFQYVSALPFTADKKFVGIYTDSFPHEGPNFDIRKNLKVSDYKRAEFYENYLKNYDGIIVGNTNLLNDYLPFTDKVIFANGIFRQNEFVENKNIGKNDGLTIGWTGTPDRPMKGFRSIIEPAVNLVQKTGRNVKLKTKFTGTYDDILNFYHDVDLVVIASSADTGPSLFAEAALSNVPSISTEIGFPKMVIKNGENGILTKRDIDEMVNAIIRLYDDRELVKVFSKKIKSDYLEVLDNKISIRNIKNLLSKSQI